MSHDPSPYAATVSPHLPIRPDWLALHSEAALEPDLPIIDAHHHIWDHANNRYLHEDVRADVSAGHRIVATVFAECGMMYRKEGPAALASLGETEYVQRVAEDSAKASAQARAHTLTSGQPAPCRIAEGIIGNVSLLQGDAAGAVLDAHLQAAPGRFKGIRNSSVYHPDPTARGSMASPPQGLLPDAQFRRGFAQLAARRLSFDGWMYHTQLDELIDLAEAFPDATIVLNHVGGPIGIGPYAGHRDQVFKEWHASMKKLARCQNVNIKLGGMGMRLFGFDFPTRDQPPHSEALAQAWAPYVNACIEAFGVERCLFQSNFPVDKGTCSYVVLWNAFKRIAAAYSPTEKQALFFGTAARVCRIGITR